MVKFFGLWAEMFWIFAFFSGLSNFPSAYREFLQRKCFFSNFGSLKMYWFWQKLPSFWQAFEIVKFWRPLHNGTKKLPREKYFFKKNIVGLWVKQFPVPGKKNTVRVLKLAFCWASGTYLVQTFFSRFLKVEIYMSGGCSRAKFVIFEGNNFFHCKNRIVARDFWRYSDFVLHGSRITFLIIIFSISRTNSLQIFGEFFWRGCQSFIPVVEQF